MVGTIEASSSLSPNAALKPGEAAPSSSRSAQSRRASNQSKDLSEMDLPDPSRLEEPARPKTLNPNLLSASDLDSTPFVKSIPSSPYLGPASSPGTNSVPRFGDTTQSDDLADQFDKLDLPEPEYLQEGNARDEAQKERDAQELAEVMDKLDLPDPEYVTRASMKAAGAKTPEAKPREEGSAQLVRSLSQKLKHLQQKQQA